MSSRLREISGLGQSVWYDFISRELLKSGQLKRLIEEDGVTGVTSNPSIFQKSISGEKIYDHDLHRLVDLGLDLNGIYEGLVIADIREAADLLLPVYEKTGGVDGYVSLEVSPELAFDTKGTINEAQRLFELVDRRNLMIKVPATPQGFPAIRDLLGMGVNVNVTLMFSLDQYRNTAHAYVEGARKWVTAGGNPAQIASVASFFVSRVDTLVDNRLEEIADPKARSAAREVMGRTGIANAKMAYELFRGIFYGEPFAELRDKGVRVQRVLWASTSTKNPAYPDTYYADNLIGPDTINTFPTATLDAFRDHGTAEARLEHGMDEAKAVFEKLEQLEVNMDAVMAQLLAEGVQAFADSFQKLLQGIEEKRSRLLRGWGHRSASLGDLQNRVDETLNWCREENTAAKIWEEQASLWKDDPNHMKEIARRLGWLRIVASMNGEVEALKAFAEDVRKDGFKHAVLLGMGGSSLAAEVFRTCYGVNSGYLDLRVLDTTVPDTIARLERGLELDRTLFIVSSKSGGTIEVVSLFKYFWEKMKTLAGNNAGKHFIAITDPGTSLGKLASENGFRKIFLNPPDIGGRFSALSYFGLVPAALIGADLHRILMRASQAVEASGPDVPPLENPGLWLGVIIAKAALEGADKLTLLISPAIESYGLWLEQLIAESTGKEGKGILPIHSEPAGTPDNYNKDRLLVYLRMDDHGDFDWFVAAMEQAGHPVVTLRLHTPVDLGREIFRWEFATAVAGAILQINPFDQPNVQESKDFTKNILELHRNEGKLPQAERLSVEDEGFATAIERLISTVKEGDYVALNAFIDPTEEVVKLLQSIRVALRNKLKTATTLGFGPRYLHSTGQIHKGGPDKGSFIQVTMDDQTDMGVPGEPYSFRILKEAQALGDYEALKRRGRRIVRVHLKSTDDLQKLLDLVKAL